ncbi:MAG: UDP-N-acetylmuramate--L-alanine ligase [Prevotellaceae bacterium]|jgi:UDP-N-acetylmuramate--alanine ligase|nr:UDP-N-acetylmuramate--L-alanine ligase [Prevotellaceae bacterium]
MKTVYLIGIGGIGMSALARYYKHAGYEVAGYDRTPSLLTAELESEGIAIHYSDDIDQIPVTYTENKDTLVIYTPAVPIDMGEFNYFLKAGYKLVKRSAVLGLIASEKQTMAVAGTHGKTTISTLLAHIITQAGGGCTAFLGGISKNYNSNLLLSDSKWLVAEADEYDRSFLQLYPQVAVITSADADHLDIYGTADEMRKAFGEFASQIKPEGVLILKNGVDIPMDNVKATVYRYAYNTPCDFYAENIELQEGGYYRFDIHTPFGIIFGCTLGVPGWVNVENAVATAAVALITGVNDIKLKEALRSFAGVKRRFDFHVNTPQHVYIDDYAHHPVELKAAITSIKQMFPGRKVTGIFQPHLYTRTRDFVADFAESLSLLDSLILLDIYPARELPIEGVTSRIIFDKVTIADKQLCTKEELLDVLKKPTIDILVTLGAGDIDRLVEPITNLIA